MIILVTGASSGIGYQVAERLAKAGQTVYGGARHLDKMKPLQKYGVYPQRLDVTDTESCKNCVDTIINRWYRIDVLINCAGYGSFGPVEEVPIREAKKQIDVNLLGIARLSKMVLPAMRKQHSGKIINISSVAGKVPVHFGDWYNVSKYAVEALSDDMRISLSHFGIQVALIEPGLIKTPWGKIAANHLKATTKGTPYEKYGMRTAEHLENAYRSDGNATPPEVLADLIAKVSASDKVKARYLVGRYATLMVFLHAILPTRLFDYFSRKF